MIERGGLFGRTERVVPRARTRFLRLDFSALPARQRASAARIALLREAGDDICPAARIGWVGGVAHVWLASADAVHGPAVRAGWWPESVLRPRLDHDGVRLLELLDGVEGQVWRAGSLVASQWWQAPPDAPAWHRFLRSAGLAVDVAPQVPATVRVGWGAPWARVQGGTASSGRGVEAAAWRAVLVVVAFALGWQVAAREAGEDAYARLQARLDALRAHAMPLLAARERADAARAEIERLRSLQRRVSDYSLMAAVITPLGKDARLLSWERQGEVLKAKVAAPESDPRRFVKAYEKTAILADVQATPVGDGAMGLEFRLPDAFKAGSSK